MVERIARAPSTAAPRAGGDAVDVLVVGAGPAGLAAALACTERGLTHRVLEQEADLGGSLLHYPRRKMVLLQPVELPLHGRIDQEEYQKEHFLELMEGLVTRARPRRPLRREGEGRAARARTASSRWGPPRAPCTARATSSWPWAGAARRASSGVPGEELSKVMYRLIDAESYQRPEAAGGGRRRQRGGGRGRPGPASPATR